MRYAILVDAGYFYAALATRMTGSSNRAAVTVHEEQLVHGLMAQAEAECGADLLRVLWYDGGNNGIPDHNQRRIGNFDGVKLRMGRKNFYGEQKGVDLRLGLDLLLMAVHHSVEFAYLISGDDDLTEAVEDAQQLGLRVKVLAVPQAGDDSQPFGVAHNLALTADGVLLIDPQSIADTVTRSTPVSGRIPDHPTPRPSSPPTPATIARLHKAAAPSSSKNKPYPLTTQRAELAYSSSTGDGTTSDPDGEEDVDIPEETIREVARRTLSVWSQTASAAELDELERGRPYIPQEADRILLADLANTCDVYELPLWARQQLRSEFWVSVDENDER